MNLSIIIPMYNSASFIVECLDSLLSKVTSKNFEIIIINDGSTDNSLAICKEYATNDNRIRVFDNENHGVSYSRNYGIDHAKGKWVMFVDSDDKLADNWYDEVSYHFDSEEDILYFYNNSDINIQGREIEYIIGLEENNLYLSSPGSKLFSRELIMKNKIEFDSNLINGEDMLFNVESLLKSSKYKIVNKNIYEYRISQNSATKRFDSKFIDSDKSFHKKLKDILLNSNLDSKRIENILNFCKLNALFVIAQRLSFSGKYDVFRSNLHVFDDYFKEINDYKIIKNKKKKIIISLLQNNCYLIVFILFNMLRLKNKKMDNFFIKI